MSRRTWSWRLRSSCPIEAQDRPAVGPPIRQNELLYLIGNRLLPGRVDDQGSTGLEQPPGGDNSEYFQRTGLIVGGIEKNQVKTPMGAAYVSLDGHEAQLEPLRHKSDVFLQDALLTRILFHEDDLRRSPRSRFDSHDAGAGVEIQER